MDQDDNDDACLPGRDLPTHTQAYLDDGCVVDDEDVLYGDGGHLRDQDTAQCIGDCWVDPNHIKLHSHALAGEGVGVGAWGGGRGGVWSMG